MMEDLPHLDSEDVNDIQQEQEAHDTIPEISVYAIAGTEHPQTICVLGKLKNKDVMVLIDGDNTHNFIDQSIVSKFSLPATKDK